MFDSVFETVNAGFAQALYEDYLRDPSSVPSSWRAVFDTGLSGEQPIEPPLSSPGGEVGAAPRTAEPDSEDKEAAGPGTYEPLKGPALRLLQNMEASLAVPTATSFRDVRVSYLWDVRKRFNALLDPRGVKLSFTHLVGWAIVLATERFPSMVRAVVEREGRPHQYDPGAVNLGLAVDVERKDGRRSLVVPVIKQVNSMTFGAFHEEYERLVAGARTNKLLPDSYQGATITLTNPGTIGTVASVPRLMAGQGSIIATGAIRGEPNARLMTLTSTYDHRIIQGAESGLFLQLVDRLLQGDESFYANIARAFGIDMPAESTTRTEPTSVGGAVSLEMLAHVAAAMSLVRAHRTHGYLAARLDPLGSDPVGDPALDPEPLGLTPEIMRNIPAEVLRVYVPGSNLWEVLPELHKTYCGSIAYELEHISAHEERVWLRRVIESGEHRTPLTQDAQRRLLGSLVRVEGLETFLHRAYLGYKRFGIEGLDMLVPILHAAIETAGEQKAEEVVMGMAHRGRLNVLTHVLGISYETLLAEFEGGREVEETLAPRGGTGDVKYHHGARGEYEGTDGSKLTVSLMANPSHLEGVNPSVEGYARAVQTTRDAGRGTHSPSRCLPILVHGDAAFPAQGVVAETFNLANLRGYDTGGTLHIIANNQVGFTTDPEDSRTTAFASDMAKGFDVPIVHVNADDPEAGIAAVRLAMLYRAKYHEDFVINLVGYRRHGHNEGDEPRYTQPLMYQRIDAQPTVKQIYGDVLVSRGVITKEEIEAQEEAQYSELMATQKRLQQDTDTADEGEEPVRITGMFEAFQEPETAVGEEVLKNLNEQLLTVPDGFSVNPKLKRQLDRRLGALEPGAQIDWGHAEALALGSLLLDGVPLRLTGQDTERGTFSQRHLMLHDSATGEKYAPAQHLPGATASFELHNSPLSEYAALGFEYGYSVRAPDTLVLWEAQFGDFANSAQVVIDQFIVAGLAKWGQTTRLVLLLPHGHEGQGPEHSSARLERFLALGAEGNIRVANCSTPAQYFHLLRRQALHGERRPLVVMTPKSLLRHPQATSTLEDLSGGQFHHVLDDSTVAPPRDEVQRLVLCSGKVYYDIVGHAQRRGATHVAVARIELLYPFPVRQIIDLFRGYRNLKEVVWVQEEPSNFGARKWVVPQVAEVMPEGIAIRHVSRPERSSPAEGYPAAHKKEQERIVTEALA
ncbi:MAG: multifunctional oxoglutarate decarboxylase/oxoglutarate dehydrogenase thiamine pyrophosphate-binding subunit/dihydrolipoyllysine-residue succinyltransferase subunit [Gemmatimonadetes bacterium]|nr:multifunctional oxoglutarate decarboxylase/oxoglutarate dehydrogenase thiamine pyrophosphate-binding subunit/dihydrolipoyllysine-residue succinyltransferase subunit [Gemmatimonadota bacterium]